MDKMEQQLLNLDLPWSGNLDISSEICCDYCHEIIHNHFDCPICGRNYSPSEQYGELEPKNGVVEIECQDCHSKFRTKGCPYDPSSIWERV